ncbi:hypothetical protein [Streptomyces aureus]|uniref:hypothetical protein n=1 Tax=Streptomyces aureus TaxID=193461 RepID=UPI00131DAFA1|nr:hypothetical protein [Streptomyces aureus]
MPTSASKSPGRTFYGISKAWALMPPRSMSSKPLPVGHPKWWDRRESRSSRLTADCWPFTPSPPLPKANRAVVGPVADAVDTVLDWDRQLPHVVVAIDRQGGDIDGTGVARSTMRAVARSAGAPCTSFE